MRVEGSIVLLNVNKSRVLTLRVRKREVGRKRERRERGREGMREREGGEGGEIEREREGGGQGGERGNQVSSHNEIRLS